jgi:predicted transcriptional regulator
MGNLSDIAVRITADPTSFEAGCAAAVQKGESLAKQLKTTFSNLSSNLGSAFSAIAGGPLGALTFGISTLGGWLKELESTSRQAALEQNKLERMFGLTNLQAAGLQFQAMRTGTSIDDLTGAMRKFMIRLGETAMSGNGTERALERIGLSSDALRQMAPTEVLGRIGDALQGVENRAERAALSHSIFGRGAHDLQAIVNSGTAGMRAAEQAADRYGLAMGRVAQQVRDAELAERRARAIGQASFAGAGRGLTGALAQLRTDFANFFAWVSGNQSFSGQNSPELAAELDRVHAAMDQERTAPAREAIDRLSLRVNNTGLNEFQQAIRDINTNLALTPDEIARSVSQIRNLEEAMRAAEGRRSMQEFSRDAQNLQSSLIGAGSRVQRLWQEVARGMHDVNDLETQAWERNALAQARAGDGMETVNRILERSITPLERLALEYEDLNKQMRDGLITQEAFARGQRALDAQFARERGDNRLAAGLTAGSSEAISALNQAQAGGPARPTAAQLDGILEELKLLRQQQERAAEDAGRNQRQPAVAQLP